MSGLETFGTVSDALARRARDAGQSLAVSFPLEGERLTFEDWDKYATQVGKGLLESGLQPGDRLALWSQNSIAWLITCLAAARAGLILVPINTYFGEGELVYALRQSGAKAIALSKSFRSKSYFDVFSGARQKVPDIGITVVLDGEESGCLSLAGLRDIGMASDRTLPEVPPSAPAVIIYTSGTTGYPKGATLTHEAVMAQGVLSSRRLGMRSDDRVTCVVPMFHSASYCTAVPGCLFTGATYIGQDAFNATSMLQVIESEKATVHIAVPTTLNGLLDHPDRASYDLSSLRVGTCGGMDVDAALLRRCAAELIPGIVQIYGLSEVSAIAACGDPTDPDRFDNCGQSLNGYRIRIVDPNTGLEVARGISGEIQISSPYAMRGYFEMPEETKATFSDDGWVKTGDIGFLREDAKLVVSGGRLKDMIIRGGENIYPAEIERVLTAYPGVEQVAVFGIKDAYYGEIVAAAIIGKDELSVSDLDRHCRERLSSYKVPVKYFRMERFPLTASGKVRKVELREMATNDQLSGL
jgi:fatty-acyl-CoA synthase